MSLTCVGQRFFTCFTPYFSDVGDNVSELDDVGLELKELEHGPVVFSLGL